MRERVANGFEAAAEIPGELLRRELSGGVERPIASPVVIVQKGLEIGEVHC